MTTTSPARQCAAVAGALDDDVCAPLRALTVSINEPLAELFATFNRPLQALGAVATPVRLPAASFRRSS